MVEKGLHPEIVVHSKSLELLGQRVGCEDHIMNLGRNKSVFIKRRPDLLRLPVVVRGTAWYSLATRGLVMGGGVGGGVGRMVHCDSYSDN